MFVQHNCNYVAQGECNKNLYCRFDILKKRKEQFMTNEIPEIKIGTTMSELKSLAEKTTGLSEVAKNSIFNFIKDEEEFGDGVISNTVELTMIKTFFADERTWWEKLCGENPEVRMPDNLQVDGYNDNISVKDEVKNSPFSWGRDFKTGEKFYYKDHFKTVRITKEVNPSTREKAIDEIRREYNEWSNTSSTSREYTSVRNESDIHVKDILVDNENDGIADKRHIVIDIGNDAIDPIEYIDTNLDGQADQKVIYAEGGNIYYERDKDGKWVIKEA